MHDPTTGPVEERPGQTALADAWLSPRRFALLLAIFVAATFPAVIFGRASFIIRDFGLFGYPLAHYHRECFWQGELPLWNPLSLCGIPYLAQWNTLTLYPLSLIYLLLPLPWSVSFFCLAHFFWGGLGMYFLASRWTGHRLAAALGGVAYCFNGLALNSLMWTNVSASLGWLPWVLLLVQAGWREGGRSLVWAILAAAMQMLSGSPEVILLTWVMLSLFACVEWFRRKQPRAQIVLRFCGITFLVTALCAGQLLPFLQLLASSQREIGYGGSDWAMPLWGWANLLVPLFRNAPTAQGVFFQQGQYWTSSYYVGIATLLLAAVAVRRRRDWQMLLLASIAAAALLLALGDSGLVFRALTTCCPGLGFMRFPVKFVILFVVVAPLLAAFGLKELASRAVGMGRFEWACLVAILLMVAAILCLDRIVLPGLAPTRATLQNGVIRAGFCILIFGLIHALLPARGGRRTLLGCLLLAVFWLDFVTHVPNQNPTVPPSVYASGAVNAHRAWDLPAQLGHSRAMLAPAAQQELKFRVLKDPAETYLLDRLGLLANCNLLDALPQVHGFFSLAPGEINDATALLYVRTNLDLTPLLDFMGVAQITAPGTAFDWASRPTAMPLITVGQQPAFAPNRAAFDAFSQSAVDLRQVVFLPPDARSVISVNRQPAARVVSASFKNHNVTFQTDAPAESIAVISQSYYPAWKAYLDGRPTRLWRANYAFQAVQVPAGLHSIHLTYEDTAFRVGLVLSLVGALACAGLWWTFKPRGLVTDASSDLSSAP